MSNLKVCVGFQFDLSRSLRKSRAERDFAKVDRYAEVKFIYGITHRVNIPKMDCCQLCDAAFTHKLPLEKTP